MRLRVLGCSGGIGPGRRTTSLLVDEDVLIDAGSGVGDLSLDEMAGVGHIFLTHSHLDHVAFIPLMLDSIFDRVDEPLVIHGLPETLEALQQHLFNGVIWPDFAQLPSPDRPVLRYAPLTDDQPVSVGGRSFQPIPVNHAVPTVAYRVATANAAFCFSGDTTTNDTLWAGLNAHAELDLLIVETAFSNADERLSRLARHYCPRLLGADLDKLDHQPEIWISHNKPGAEGAIFAECQAAAPKRTLHRLGGGEVFQL